MWPIETCGLLKHVAYLNMWPTPVADVN